MLNKEQKMNNYFISILNSTSELSTCYRVKVGSIIVDNGRIISTGYNGTPAGMLECEEYKGILSSLYSKIGKKEINTLQEVNEYITLKISEMNKGYEKNKDLMSFIYDENEKYYTNHYIDELQTLYSSNNINNKKDFLVRNNIFHSDNSILGEIHAEQNALLYASRMGISVVGCDLYCNYLPCSTCSKLIKQAGIKRVFYIQEYAKGGIKSSKFFRLNGIELIKMKKQ